MSNNYTSLNTNPKTLTTLNLTLDDPYADPNRPSRR